jgi:hypothetical protein
LQEEGKEWVGEVVRIMMVRWKGVEKLNLRVASAEECLEDFIQIQIDLYYDSQYEECTPFHVHFAVVRAIEIYLRISDSSFLL